MFFFNLNNYLLWGCLCLYLFTYHYQIFNTYAIFIGSFPIILKCKKGQIHVIHYLFLCILMFFTLNFGFYTLRFTLLHISQIFITMWSAWLITKIFRKGLLLMKFRYMYMLLILFQFYSACFLF